MIAANNGHILAFDNLSGLPFWLSDALCRVASGGSFAIRQLYTDCDEILFQAARPAILNGIEDIVCRSDLADRAIFLALGPISDERRRAERQLGQEFEALRRGSWAPSSTQRPTACGSGLAYALNARRAWLISRCGESPVKRHFGRLAPFCASMMPTVGPRSKAPLRPIPWPPLCGKSWPCAAHGQEGPRIFCVPISPQAKRYGSELQAGQVIHVPSPAGYGAARRF
jgi:hypothetical protein